SHCATLLRVARCESDVRTARGLFDQLVSYCIPHTRSDAFAAVFCSYALKEMALTSDHPEERDKHWTSALQCLFDNYSRQESATSLAGLAEIAVDRYQDSNARAFQGDRSSVLGNIRKLLTR